MTGDSFEQGLLHYLSPQTLAKLQCARIGVAGAGGLGSNVVMALVRTGLLFFTVADFDCVEYHNLNRQNYIPRQVGMPKVVALAENAKVINPHVHMETFHGKVTSQNAPTLFKDCHIVVEAFDNVESKMMLANCITHKPLIMASGIAGFGDSDAIKVHQVHENLYVVGDLQKEANKQTPPLAPRVFIAAAKQANIVLELILSEKGCYTW